MNDFRPAHDALLDWAGKTPDRVFLHQPVDGELRTYTWQEVADESRRMANALLGLGLKNGDKVAILAKNSVEFLSIYFAAGQRGLVAQPLNWRLGTVELQRIIEDAEPGALIYSGEFESVASELQRATPVPHWLGFGPGTDRSFEALVDRSSPAIVPAAAGLGSPSNVSCESPSSVSTLNRASRISTLRVNRVPIAQR